MSNKFGRSYAPMEIWQKLYPTSYGSTVYPRGSTTRLTNPRISLWERFDATIISIRQSYAGAICFLMEWLPTALIWLICIAGTLCTGAALISYGIVSAIYVGIGCAIAGIFSLAVANIVGFLLLIPLSIILFIIKDGLHFVISLLTCAAAGIIIAAQ